MSTNGHRFKYVRYSALSSQQLATDVFLRALRDPLPKNTFFPSSRTSRFYADSFSDQILSLADWPNAYDALTPSTRQ
ncbi:hypothetical protein QR680_002826 [Steinernema hermaphroditum]|uniref:Uncharacterized protein n=1 Tax=Steinernema hermaphroditum TaxID=289476 RepID=A0AA39H484_9BILA|nr:hypothetical protein QR680_002826 [Steinernema hermaphroditum]